MSATYVTLQWILIHVEQREKWSLKSSFGKGPPSCLGPTSTLNRTFAMRFLFVPEPHRSFVPKAVILLTHPSISAFRRF